MFRRFAMEKPWKNQRKMVVFNVVLWCLGFYGIPSGCVLPFALENGPLKFVDLPVEHGDFHIKILMNTYNARQFTRAHGLRPSNMAVNMLEQIAELPRPLFTAGSLQGDALLEVG